MEREEVVTKTMESHRSPKRRTAPPASYNNGPAVLDIERGAKYNRVHGRQTPQEQKGRPYRLAQPQGTRK